MTARTRTGRFRVLECWSAENSKCNIYIAFAGSTAGSTDIWVRLAAFGDVDVARGRRPGVPDVTLGPRFMGWGVTPRSCLVTCPTSTTTLRLPTRAGILALIMTVLSPPKSYLHFVSLQYGRPPLPRPLPFLGVLDVGFEFVSV